MANTQSASVIDELFVSLGLKTDSESFRKGSDAVDELKSGFLQLAAMTGTGLGLKAVTMDLAKAVQNMERLSRVTGRSVESLRALRHTFRVSGLSEAGADGFAQQLKNIDVAVKTQTLPEDAYRSGKFSPQEFSRLYSENPDNATRYLIKSLNEETNEAQRMRVMGALGITQNPEYRNIVDNGVAGYDRGQQSWAKYGKALPEGLDKDAEIFLERLGTLQTQFGQLSESIGKDLLPPINALLSIISNFAKSHPDIVKTLAYLAGAGGAVGGAKLIDKFLPKGNGGGLKGKAGNNGVKGGKSGWGRMGLYALAAEMLYDPVEEDLEDKLGDTKFGAWTKEHGFFYTSDGSIFFSKTAAANHESGLSGGKPKTMPRVQGREAGLFSGIESKYGLPAGLLNATYQKESGGGKYLHSKAGAMGPFQFMPGTAADMGLYGDDVYDLDKSADAAGRYYKMLLKRYGGDTSRAIAAYNHGMGNIDKKGLSGLPAETLNYVPSILSGLDNSEDLLADYNARKNQGPSFGAGEGSQIIINQTNSATVHATGADPQDTARVMREEWTNNIDDALAQTATEKY